MQKKNIALIMAVGLAVFSSPLYAAPMDNIEVAAMAYVNIPFGGIGSKQEAPILGFSVNRVLPGQRDGLSYQADPLQQPLTGKAYSLVDVRFNTRKKNWSRFDIGGVDALIYKVRMNADGTTKTEATGVSSEAIGAVAIGALVIGLVVAVGNEIKNNIDTISNSVGNAPEAINKNP